jgi:hypothetical protein
MYVDEFQKGVAHGAGNLASSVVFNTIHPHCHDEYQLLRPSQLENLNR